jgi:hypothetical protein
VPKALQQKLQVQPIKVAAGSKIRKCQRCKTGNLQTILLDQRGPPVSFPWQ